MRAVAYITFVMELSPCFSSAVFSLPSPDALIPDFSHWSRISSAKPRRSSLSSSESDNAAAHLMPKHVPNSRNARRRSSGYSK